MEKKLLYGKSFIQRKICHMHMIFPYDDVRHLDLLYVDSSVCAGPPLENVLTHKPLLLTQSNQVFVNIAPRNGLAPDRRHAIS